MRYRSKLATMVDNPRDVKDRRNPRAFGVMQHTTGRGILATAKRHGIEPIEAAINVYTRRGGFFPHYVVHNQWIIQIADERERASHAGMPRAQYELYRSGKWRSMVAKKTLARWVARWPGVKSPVHLFPGRSANNVFVGVENIPRPDGTFSPQTLNSSARISADILYRHRGGVGELNERSNFQEGCRHLLGHEDVEPLERWNRHGGWDPGALRLRPKWSWFDFCYRIFFADIGRMESDMEVA